MLCFTNLKSFLFIIILLLAFYGRAWGNESSPENYIPGGEEVKKLIEERKGKTELSKLATQMKHGTWADLNVETPKGLWSAPPPSKGLHIGTWSDDAHWDSRTGQFLYFGVRQTRKMVAYSEEKNTWRVIEFADKKNAPELLQKFGHQYSTNSHDPERSRFFTGLYCYDIVNDTWSELPAVPDNMGSGSMTFEYFTAMDGLLTIARQPKSILRIFNENTKEWSNLGSISVHGYHSLARHNPYLKEVFFGGGNNSKKITIVTNDGKAVDKKDLPVNVEKFTINPGFVTVDPLSGRYLIMLQGRIFIEYDSIKDEHRLIDDFTITPWPFEQGGIGSYIVAHIPEYGVTMWAGPKIFLYKHKLCTGKPLTTENSQILK